MVRRDLSDVAPGTAGGSRAGFPAGGCITRRRSQVTGSGL